jgi:HPt (histidine-containing phosphotransfer) domain-containing protein/CheY-like chemotaxis protein
MRPLGILVVEENPVVRQTLVRLIEKKDHRVCSVCDEAEASQVASQGPFHVVFVSETILGCSGTQFLEALEANCGSTRQTYPLAVVTLVSDPPPGMPSASERCPVRFSLKVPIRSRELFDLLEQIEATLPGQTSPIAPSPSPGGETEAGCQEALFLDEKEGLARVQGDRELYAELLALFADDCHRLKQQLAEAIASKNTLLLKRAAHTLKGAAGSIGAGSLADAARTVEALAAADQVEEATVWAGRVLALLDQIPAAVQPILARAKNGSVEVWGR